MSVNNERYELMLREPGPFRRHHPQAVTEHRSKLPKNDSGEVICEVGHVIPEEHLECPTCHGEKRRAWEQAKLVNEIRWAWEQCSGSLEDASLPGSVESSAPRLPSWPWARLDNAAFRKAVSQKLLKAVERWNGRANLALCAPTGTGKTSLINAKVHSMYESALEAAKRGEKAEPLWFTFTTALDLVAARRTHKLGSSEPKLIEAALTSGRLLILDEIGFEDLRDQLILEVADSRSKRGLLTVITTGRTPAEFAARYGAAVWRRFTEGGDAVEDFEVRK
jgi:DNA replication protein DnaC